MTATRGFSRVAAHAARCPPALWPIATTRRAVDVRQFGQVVDRGAHVVERRPARRRRCRAAGTRCSTPPSRARRGPRASASISVEAVLGLPEAAVDEHRDRPLAVQHAVLRGVVAVAMPLRRQGPDGLGELGDALVDLLRGHARVREAQRVLAALEQEVGALDEQHVALGRGLLELGHVDPSGSSTHMK